jgi:hypothetical protein
MGLFAYSCEKCDFGHVSDPDGHCGWDDNMVLKFGRVKICGVYDGYGRMRIDEKDTKRPMFQGVRGIELNGNNEFDIEAVEGRGKIYCSSCLVTPVSNIQ